MMPARVGPSRREALLGNQPVTAARKAAAGARLGLSVFGVRVDDTLQSWREISE